jgi:hypothetical protein
MSYQSFTSRLAIGLLATAALAAQEPSHAGTHGLSAVDVDSSQFAIVAAPIPGSGGSQLQIYEQIGSQRACYAVNGDTVDPLLVSFDFTNICQRYIDSNGYSLRIGSQDLGTIYRLSIRRNGSEHMLMAIPTKPGAGPELRVARAIGDGEKFLRLELESGWSLRRRNWQGTNLGHLYVYRDNWPQANDASIAGPDTTRPASRSTPLVQAVPVQPVKAEPTTNPASAPNPLF